MSGAMQSNVGNSQIYEANEQRTGPGAYDREHPAPFEAGQENAHDQLDSKDNRNLYQTAAQAEKVEKDERRAERELAQEQKDPLSAVRPAERHGNEPSKGAKIDKEIMQEEQEELKRKGRA